MEELKLSIEKMNDAIVHRGPDDQGVFLKEKDTYSVAMSMRRLSIIDLSSGGQPIFSDDGAISIVFNGEIYNYKELRATLISENTLFNTHSDTEVILRLYEKYGVESFRLLDGMYSFSIYDGRLDKLFVARDYFGEKPLYYLYDEY